MSARVTFQHNRYYRDKLFPVARIGFIRYKYVYASGTMSRNDACFGGSEGRRGREHFTITTNVTVTGPSPSNGTDVDGMDERAEEQEEEAYRGSGCSA